MSKFTELMKDNPPRLVIKYSLADGPEGSVQENFSWGIIGNGVPIMSLIGYLGRVQASLPDRKGSTDCTQTDEKSLVIVWSSHRKRFDWYVHPDIPTNALLGMIEMVKQTFLAAQMARAAQANAKDQQTRPVLATAEALTQLKHVR